MPAKTGTGENRVVDRAEEPVRKRRSWIRQHPAGALLILIGIAALVAGGILWWRYTNTYEETDDAQVAGHVTDISARIAGTVAAVHVAENQFVEQGTVLVELDSRDYQVEVQRAEANLSQAQAQVQAETPSVPIRRTTSQAQISTARANVTSAEAALAASERDYESQRARIAQAEANNQRAQADLQRYSMLVAKDEVSQQEYDQRVAAAK